MHVRLLGNVEVATADGWRRAGPAKQSAVLAVLAVSLNRPVNQRTLLERVWGDAPPPSGYSALYSNLARLRRLIADVPGVSIERGGDGYRLTAEPEAVDLFRMRSLAEAARRATAEGRHSEAAGLWRAAKACRHGRPLNNVEGGWVDETRRELQREWSSLLHDHFAAELECGRHTEVVAELTEAVLAHPLDERLTAVLMRALYRDGRQSEALEQFQRISRLTRTGPELRDLYRRILQQEPGLRGAASADPVPRQLPRPPGGTGRDEELRRLSGLHDGESRHGGVPLLIVTGAAGTGKTDLVLRWAADAAVDFPDGQLFHHMGQTGVSDPQDVLTGFLCALGVAAEEIPRDADERIALYRSTTADRRILVVLDDVADPAMVRPLLPGGPGSLVLVTSRNGLSGLVALNGARRLTLAADGDEALSHADG
ncbi:DNA-binding SARP family transcriptional activator [Stackebrandtia albiflava]|uniref:DNA-binding SARP family transcriptional activator n=1 Tax=Stackebrandtia albiflava TaxID=406432 RepID=A0A562V2E9_9ACTN|nr:BTAD domain-containing putative transcriptional regulator [Stackebrandtia albiflava]TWJ11987.1 DNA-binding SARP family transcriptional activator [Stackebrandtia albiflava]